MVDEKERRRADWREGTEVRLGNGQGWHLRHPPYRRAARPAPGGGYEFSELRRPRFDDLMEAMLDAEEGMVQINTALNIAVLMLEQNYDLTADDVAELLPWAHGDESNVEMWQAILGIAAGNLVPKA